MMASVHSDYLFRIHGADGGTRRAVKGCQMPATLKGCLLRSWLVVMGKGKLVVNGDRLNTL